MGIINRAISCTVHQRHLRRCAI